MAALLPAFTTATYKRVAGADPAAGIEVSETVPLGKTWVLFSVQVQLVQGITQTPQPILQVDDGTTVLFEAFGATAAQAVSTTALYSWIVGGPAPGALVGTTPNIHALSILPDELVLPGGFRVKTSTLGIGANTNYGAPSLYVVELG